MDPELLKPVRPADVPRVLKPHELAVIFPLLEGIPFDKFAKDIKNTGLREPVVLYEHKILDGRNRDRACKQVGVQVRYVRYCGDDPRGFVISMNLERRHLSETQRSMCAGRAAPLKPGGDPSNRPVGLMTQAEAAELFSVSPMSIKRARVVLDRGAPELVAAVDRDLVAVSA